MTLEEALRINRRIVAWYYHFYVPEIGQIAPPMLGTERLADWEQARAIVEGQNIYTAASPPGQDGYRTFSMIVDATLLPRVFALMKGAYG